MVEAKSYKETVNLPQTNFNMRANSVTREPEIQKFWAESQINRTYNNDKFLQTQVHPLLPVLFLGRFRLYHEPKI